MKDTESELTLVMLTGLPVNRTTKGRRRVCYECPKIHRWEDIREHWSSIPLAT
ncbi:hypothetical protein MTR_7g011673 [Medicago truncatula]|uniref:Uncharacterized protein n=1 Tax=Medicago truncatula TaxID=3880 RepID=A0A072TXN3_MEDTR|nr:hypothetical protein MTR_7g011673 [Medicago truncatula]